jgi:hypothetical protein
MKKGPPRNGIYQFSPFRSPPYSICETRSPCSEMRRCRWTANLETENVPVADSNEKGPARAKDADSQASVRARHQQGCVNGCLIEARRRGSAESREISCVNENAPHQGDVAHLLVMNVEAVRL